jgi:MarR-like DNA-binding transcriptional regulator SgrR of sgrS sRNA
MTADIIDTYDALVESCAQSGVALTAERVAYMLSCSVRYAQCILDVGAGAEIDRAHNANR